MIENIFVLKMLNPAIPSFCTSYKEYAGTLDDMKILHLNINNKFLGKDELCHEILIKQSMEEYFNGNENAINKGLYGNEPIFVPISIINMCKHNIQNKEIIHKNIWDCEYKLRFRECIIESIVTQNKDNEKYKTFVKFYFINLELFNNFLNNWEGIKVPTWGNPGILIKDETLSENIAIYTPVYLQDKVFNNLNDAKNYILDKNQIDYSTVFEEIFGDG